MTEAFLSFNLNENYNQIRKIQESILPSWEQDSAKQVPAREFECCEMRLVYMLRCEINTFKTMHLSEKQIVSRLRTPGRGFLFTSRQFSLFLL